MEYADIYHLDSDLPCPDCGYLDCRCEEGLTMADMLRQEDLLEEARDVLKELEERRENES